MTSNDMSDQLFAEIEGVLKKHQANGWEKLQEKMKDTDELDQKRLFYVFAICSRWFGAAAVEIPQEGSLITLDKYNILQQWNWTNFARLYLLLLLSRKNTRASYISLYKDLFHNADVKESIVLIQSLSFLPDAEAFVAHAREAARSNITSLFSAVAHQNQYASQYFDLDGWNQLILKAAFVAVPIWPIIGLKERNNDALVNMLIDYARERQIANRTVPWDLWCCVGWKANDDYLQQLSTQFHNGDIRTKAAIAKSLSENPGSRAQQLAKELYDGDNEMQRAFDSEDNKRSLSTLQWHNIAEVST